MKRIHFFVFGVCSIVIISAIVGAFLSNPSSQQLAIKSPTRESLGVCLHLSDFNASTEVALVDLGVRWVRVDWEIGRMGTFMQEMDKNGIGVLAIIDHVTMKGDRNFTLDDWQGNVSAIMASPEAKSVDAWEIWNEPNAEQFFFGYMDGSPEQYLDMLKTAYPIIKSSSNASVVSAGLSPNETRSPDEKEVWLQWHNSLDDLGAESFFDIQGMHLYGDHPTNLEMIDSVSSDKPVWVTEIGKPSNAESYTEVNQANFLADNIPPLSSRVDKVFWYELIDCQGIDPPKENYFGLTDTSYNRKPAYVELKGIIESLPK